MNLLFGVGDFLFWKDMKNIMKIIAFNDIDYKYNSRKE